MYIYRPNAYKRSVVVYIFNTPHTGYWWFMTGISPSNKVFKTKTDDQTSSEIYIYVALHIISWVITFLYDEWKYLFYMAGLLYIVTISIVALLKSNTKTENRLTLSRYNLAETYWSLLNGLWGLLNEHQFKMKWVTCWIQAKSFVHTMQSRLSDHIEPHLWNYLFAQLNCAEQISCHVGHHYEANVISFTAYSVRTHCSSV